MWRIKMSPFHWVNSANTEAVQFTTKQEFRVNDHG